MACMDHECVGCGHAWMDNAYAYLCPKCGERVTNNFDEPTYDEDRNCDEPFDGDADERCN